LVYVEDNSTEIQGGWVIWSSRLSTLLVAFYQLIAVAFLLIVPFFAYNFFKTPFIGAFVEHTLALNSSGPSGSGTWELKKHNLPFGYRIISVKDTAIILDQLQALLRQFL
jgi:hypothetical protein